MITKYIANLIPKFDSWYVQMVLAKRHLYHAKITLKKSVSQFSDKINLKRCILFFFRV